MSGVVYDYDDEPQAEKSGECCVKNSAICYWMGGGKCGSCYIGRIKDQDARKGIAKNWDVMLSNLPEDIDSLANSDTCVLCKGEKNKAECYAFTDLAHPDPPAKKGMIFGLGKKVRIPVGSMFTLHMACCRKCRSRIHSVNASFMLIFLGLLAAGIIITCFTPALGGLGVQGTYIGLAVIVGLGVGGYFLGKLVSKVLAEKISKEMYSDIRGLYLVDQMFSRGWFVYDSGKEVYEPRLFFKNKRDFKNVFPPEDFAVDSETRE